MRNRFDELAKQLAEAGLGPCGETTTQERMNPETQFADIRHLPAPHRDAERARIGLLGRLAASPCLIETYSRAPGTDDFRACVLKHLAFWQQRARAGSSAPFLWLVAAGVPRTLLAAPHFAPADAWPRGVYLFWEDVMRIGLVIAAELPADPSTLLVRLMAGGPLLTPAIAEVAALPEGSPVRVVAEPVLLQFQYILEQAPELLPEEQEFIMVMHKSWSDARAEGRAEGRAEALRKQLTIKFGELTPETESRITGATPDQLDRYLERVLFADSLAAVFA